MAVVILESEQKKIRKHEKRYFPRWEVSKRVEHIENRGAFRSYTKDLSLDGASIFIFGDLPARKSVRLKIHLTDKESFEAQCRVAWSKLEPTHKEFGIIFENLSKKAQEVIMRYAFEPRKDDLFLSRLIKSVNAKEEFSSKSPSSASGFTPLAAASPGGFEQRDGSWTYHTNWPSLSMGRKEKR